MDFGATVDGVLTYIPHITLSTTSKPSLDQVAALIASYTAQVHLSIGSLVDLDDDFLQKVVTTARMCVEMGTAAAVENARFPERANSQTNTSYAGVLFAQYRALLTELAERVQIGDDTSDQGMPVPSAGVLWNRPTTPLGVETTLIPDAPTEILPGGLTSDSDLIDPAENGAFL